MSRRFHLERVARLRRQGREQAQDALAAANVALAHARATLAGACAGEDATVDAEAAELHTGLVAAELQRSRANLALLRRRRLQLEGDVARAGATAGSRRGELLGCRRAERQLELLGEQLREQWMAAQTSRAHRGRTPC